MHFPVSTEDRLHFLLSKIYINESIDNWFYYEYQLKDYEKYGIKMILGDADVDDIINRLNEKL